MSCESKTADPETDLRLKPMAHETNQIQLVSSCQKRKFYMCSLMVNISTETRSGGMMGKHPD